VSIAGTLIGYDCLVRRRNDKVVTAAARTSAIVSSLFPAQVRAQLLQEDHFQTNVVPSQGGYSYQGSTSLLRGFISGKVGDTKANTVPDIDDVADRGNKHQQMKPIASFFPDTTVFFGDIAGFTSWSAARPPEQVFVLLETMYRAFDEIAHEHGVYKVETIGDCYIAVAGLPDPQPDHAVIMASFARQCIAAMNHLVKRLEVHLGDGTQSLSLRIGLHSGPVTAGVLRGDRARFQLFGDTVNMTAHMESTSLPGRIQVSSATADCLTLAGKAASLAAREESVATLGAGQVETFWLTVA
jgi:class 3 adenylate cyclase